MLFTSNEYEISMFINTLIFRLSSVSKIETPANILIMFPFAEIETVNETIPDQFNEIINEITIFRSAEELKLKLMLAEITYNFRMPEVEQKRAECLNEFQKYLEDFLEEIVEESNINTRSSLKKANLNQSMGNLDKPTQSSIERPLQN